MKTEAMMAMLAAAIASPSQPLVLMGPRPAAAAMRSRKRGRRIGSKVYKPRQKRSR